MTLYSDAALLKGDYAHMAAEFRAGDRSAPAQKDWDKTACDNNAEAAAQEVAKHIFAAQKNLDAKKEELEILTYSAAGPIKVLALMPGEGDILRVDGVQVETGMPVSVVIHSSQLSLTFVRKPINAEPNDDGLQIGFVIFDELKERQKARYKKKPSSKAELSKPFGLPPKRKAEEPKSAANKKKRQ